MLGREREREWCLRSLPLCITFLYYGRLVSIAYTNKPCRNSMHTSNDALCQKSVRIWKEKKEMVQILYSFISHTNTLWNLTWSSRPKVVSFHSIFEIWKYCNDIKGNNEVMKTLIINIKFSLRCQSLREAWYFPLHISSAGHHNLPFCLVYTL